MGIKASLDELRETFTYRVPAGGCWEGGEKNGRSGEVGGGGIWRGVVLGFFASEINPEGLGGSSPLGIL